MQRNISIEGEKPHDGTCFYCGLQHFKSYGHHPSNANVQRQYRADILSTITYCGLFKKSGIEG